MKKAGVLSLLLILFAVTVIANNPIASATHDPQSSTPMEAPPAPAGTMESKAPIPSPSLMLLIGSGLVGLIIYRKKYKDKK